MGKMGRPPTTGQTRGNVLHVRASDDERAAWQALADAAGLTLAVWMHDACAKAAAAAKRRRH